MVAGPGPDIGYVEPGLLFVEETGRDGPYSKGDDGGGDQDGCIHGG